MKGADPDPNDEALRVRCEICRKDFVAGPDDFWEAGFTAEFASDEEVTGTPEGEVITPDKLAAMSEYELGEIGLTPESRDALLDAPVGTDVTTGGCAICPDCAKEFGQAEDGKEASDA